MTLTVLDILWDSIESSQFGCSEDKAVALSGHAFSLWAPGNNKQCFYFLLLCLIFFGPISREGRVPSLDHLVHVTTS